ncbi:MAG TPA: hypothetical protein VD834_05495 [Blastococcus sp.]|nr:hypothetical protein [Blastococcus sp.]
MSRGAGTPCLTAGGVTVVVDGIPRLRWSSTGPAEWRLRDVWPSPQEERWLHERIAEGDPMLVVLGADTPCVAVYPEEFWAQRERFASVVEDAELVELTLPILDWLPEPLRSRGQVFAEQAAAALRSMPVALRPPLLVETRSEPCSVRFARCAGAPPRQEALLEVARHVFATAPVLAVAP